MGAMRLEQAVEPPEVAEVSARKMFMPQNSPMSLIQCERVIDLPRLIGIAWNTPVGLRAYWVRALKKGLSGRRRRAGC